jgi:hypothetical protein
VTSWGYKSERLPLRTPIFSRIIRHSLLISFSTVEMKDREKEGKEERKRGDSWDLESVASPSLSSHGRTRLDPFQGHAGSPAKPSELEVFDGGRGCGLPCAEGPCIPTPIEGYVVALVAFYKWGLGVPSHRFLHSLLRQYDLELHNLTPWGILHVATIVTLCEAYMGIDLYFSLWNYVTPGFKPKLNAQSMCAQESSFYTDCTENGYIITNVII